MKEVNFNVYVNIHGCVEMEDDLQGPNDLLDAIFPDGWNGEVFDVFTDPSFMPKGYMEITNVEEDDL